MKKIKGSEYFPNPLYIWIWVCVCVCVQSYSYSHLSLTCGSPHIARQSGWWRRKPRQQRWPRAATLCRRGEQWSSPRPASRPCESAHTSSLVHSHSRPQARTLAKTGYKLHRIWGKKERKGRSKLFICAHLFHLDQTATFESLDPPSLNHVREERNPCSIYLSFVSHLLSFSPYWLSVSPWLTLLSSAPQFRRRFWSFHADGFSTIRHQTCQCVWLLFLLGNRMHAYCNGDSAFSTIHRQDGGKRSFTRQNQILTNFMKNPMLYPAYANSSAYTTGNIQAVEQQRTVHCHML